MMVLAVVSDQVLHIPAALLVAQAYSSPQQFCHVLIYRGRLLLGVIFPLPL